jgi:hypothetical protein
MGGLTVDDRGGRRGLQIQIDRLLPLKLEGIRDNRKGLVAQMCRLEVWVGMVGMVWFKREGKGANLINF